jgi:hypothetical protein
MEWSDFYVEGQKNQLMTLIKQGWRSDMNYRNFWSRKDKTAKEPRFLNPSTIKKIENIAYTDKDDQESDVKTWIPKSPEINACNE